MCTSKILCVTNRKLCQEDFLSRIEKIAACHPAGIILREKDLSIDEYEELALKVMKICSEYQVPCILHSFVNVALKLQANAIHMPLHLLREMRDEDKQSFTMIGASCHSVEDALEAKNLGCTYITAGHVFETDCKKGLPGRGISFLKGVCDAVEIPVYGIGGIDTTNISQIYNFGASGACLMSSLMICEEVSKYLNTMEVSNDEVS